MRQKIFFSKCSCITNMIQLLLKKVILFDRYIYLTEHYQGKMIKLQLMILHFIIQMAVF